MNGPEREAVAYNNAMNIIAHRLALFMSQRQPGDTYVIAIRPNDIGLGCSGRILKTLDPADEGTAKILKSMESQIQESLVESQSPKGTS